jgi:transposase-like protein
VGANRRLKTPPITPRQQEIYDCWLANDKRYKPTARAMGLQPEKVRQAVAAVQYKLRQSGDINPICRFCYHPHTVKAGLNAKGPQRYKCKSCGKRFVPEPQSPGMPPIAGETLSSADRQRKWRDSLTPEQKAALTAKKSAANRLRRQRLKERK